MALGTESRPGGFLRIEPAKRNQSHGTGEFRPEEFRRLGDGVVFERGVLVFHPETIEIGEDVYIGHYTILKGYHSNSLIIGAHTWIGQQCFIHSAGGIQVGAAVGIGPQVRILSSEHRADELQLPVLFSPLEFAPVCLGDGCDIGMGATILPGVTIGEGAIIGAGSVVTRDVPAYCIAAGVPCRVIRDRRGS